VKAYSSPCSTITQIAPDPFGSYGRRAGISLASSEYSWTFSPRTLSPLWKVKRTDQEKGDKRGVRLTFRAESASGEATFGLVAVRRLRDRTSRA